MSPSPSEKKALIFLAGVLFVGGFVKATGAARRVEHADAASREALRRQIVAAESAAAVERKERSGRGERRSARSRRVGPGSNGQGTGVSGDAAGSRAASGMSVFDAPVPRDRIDVDRATAEQLEELPRIGSALAARIVEERERNGPYGSLEGLQRVRGIGPAMAKLLASAVTFSGTPRPSNAGEAGASPSIDGGARRRRKAARASPPP